MRSSQVYEERHLHKIDDTLAAQGLHIPYEDLLIGVTALHLGFDVLTTNARHFAMIPGLIVKKP